MTKKKGTPIFDNYHPVHKERLQGFAETSQWQGLLSREATLKQWKKETRKPTKAPTQQIKANEYLRERNAGRVHRLLDEGVTDEKKLLEVLGNWEAALLGKDAFPIVFLGLVVTMDCSFITRCMYCNQIWIPRRLTLDDWKNLLSEVAEPVPPYVYLTGGEPLILGAEIWGDNGLTSFATKLGCAVNINTNATLIKPHIAMQLVKVGLAKLHISLDCPDQDLQDELLLEPGRMSEVLEGIFNVQIAREVLGANHPEIHINCVLTHRNLFQFPALLRFLLEIGKTPSVDFKYPLFSDFSFHLIPVGGSENALLRPSKEEWKRFYTETWAEAEQIWHDYQESVGVIEKERKSLTNYVPFANPFLRADHHVDLDAYCEHAAQGEYWEGALTESCYVAPTQAFVLPDGSQHWCGAHAIRHPMPLGNVTDTRVRENIRSNISHLNEYPNEFCTGCAGATCFINQAAKRNLQKQIFEWMQEHKA
jgi:MoaA/NifB/PqqE/SkfB family radical SAM enzyme